MNNSNSSKQTVKGTMVFWLLVALFVTVWMQGTPFQAYWEEVMTVMGIVAWLSLMVRAISMPQTA